MAVESDIGDLHGRHESCCRMLAHGVLDQLLLTQEVSGNTCFVVPNFDEDVDFDQAERDAVVLMHVFLLGFYFVRTVCQKEK